MAKNPTSNGDVVARLARAKYVSLTTYKQDGAAVSVPVWIAGYGDGKQLAVITESTTWKVKRLRNDPRVRLAVSDGRGRVKPGADSVEGTAELVTGDDAQGISRLIDAKYGLMAKVVIPIVYKVRNLIQRRRPAEAVGIVITPDT
jgi:PPOX class probable F420-dependent enzyme